MESAAWVLVDAIAEAESVVNDASSTPQQVTTAVQALQPALYGFRDQLQAASSQTTDAALKAAIANFVSEIPTVAAAAATGDFNAFVNAFSATTGDEQVGALCGF
jgi:hypothetical protein